MSSYHARHQGVNGDAATAATTASLPPPAQAAIPATSSVTSTSSVSSTPSATVPSRPLSGPPLSPASDIARVRSRLTLATEDEHSPSRRLVHVPSALLDGFREDHEHEHEQSVAATPSVSRTAGESGGSGRSSGSASGIRGGESGSESDSEVEEEDEERAARMHPHSHSQPHPQRHHTRRSSRPSSPQTADRPHPTALSHFGRPHLHSHDVIEAAEWKIDVPSGGEHAMQGATGSQTRQPKSDAHGSLHQHPHAHRHQRFQHQHPHQATFNRSASAATTDAFPHSSSAFSLRYDGGGHVNGHVFHSSSYSHSSSADDTTPRRSLVRPQPIMSMSINDPTYKGQLSERTALLGRPRRRHGMKMGYDEDDTHTYGGCFGWVRRCCRKGVNVLTSPTMIISTLVILIALSSGIEQSSRKLLAANLFNYRWFLFELASLTIFVVTGLTCCWWERNKVKHSIKHHGVPIKFLMATSLLDALHSLALLVAIGILPVSWALLLPQLLIPITILFRSLIHKGWRCFTSHGSSTSIVGCSLVLLAAGMIMLPDLMHFESCPALDIKEEVPARGGAGGAQYVTFHPESKLLRRELLVYASVLVASLIPNALSHLYKQSFLQSNPVHLPLMHAGLSGGQLVWGALLAPFVIELQYAATTAVQIPSMQPAPAAPPPNQAPWWTPAGNDTIPLVIPGTSTASATTTAAFSLTALVADVAPDSLRYMPRRNLFANWAQGWNCLMGKSSVVGDRCEQLFPGLLLQLLLFLVALGATQWFLLHLLRRVTPHQSNLVSSSLALGSLVGLGLFEIQSVYDWLPTWDLGSCMQSGLDWWTLWTAAPMILLGGVVAQWQKVEEPPDLDIWGRLESIAAQEEQEKGRRARTHPRSAKARVGPSGSTTRRM